MRLLFILLSCFLSSAWAEGTVRVVVDDYPPWKIVRNGQAVAGIDLALTEALLAKLGLRPVYVVCPWQRCLLELRKGGADLVSGIVRNPEREAYLAYFSFPYKTKSVKEFYVRKGEGSRYRQLEDFAGKTVATLRGASHFPEFDTSISIVKYQTATDETSFRMLAHGRLDALVITRESGRYLLKLHPEWREQMELAHYRFEGRVEDFFAISRLSPLFSRQAELEEALRKMLANGEVRRLLEKMPD